MRRLVRRARRRLIGAPPDTVVNRLIRNHQARFETFCQAVELVNFEAVPGDILEFGVFAGSSLALLAKAHSFDPKGMERRLIGFDSFTGLPDSAEEHARWEEGSCATLHGWHPLLAEGEPVTPQVTRDLFAACELPEPRIVEGPFEQSLPPLIPAEIPRAALVHIDCDLYESTRTVLEAIAPALEEGTLLLFDDWFHFKGNPAKGEARAFTEFLADHSEWRAQQYRVYATFCNSFILYRP